MGYAKFVLGLVLIIGTPNVWGEDPPGLAADALVSAGENPHELTGPADEAGPAEEMGPAIRARVERLEKAMWWNRPGLVGRLQLGEPQRRRMGQIFADYFTQRLETRETGPRPDSFRRAVVATDLDAAREEIARRAQRAAATATADARMIVDVLAELSPSQLETLAMAYPRVLRAAWFTEIAGPGGRRAKGTPRGLRAVPPSRTEARPGSAG